MRYTNQRLLYFILLHLATLNKNWVGRNAKCMKPCSANSGVAKGDMGVCPTPSPVVSGKRSQITVIAVLRRVRHMAHDTEIVTIWLH